MATKRKGEPIRDQDPDYETVSVMTASKRQRLFEKDAKDLTVKKIEGIIKRQFAIEMRHKEKEVELIDERIHQVRAMLDKLRACVMANYYGNIGLTQSNAKGEKMRSIKTNLNHPAIQRALKSTLKSQSSSEIPDGTSAENVAPNGTSVTAAMAEIPGTPSSGQWSGQQSERSSPESEQLSRVELAEAEEEPNLGVGRVKGPRNTGPDTFGVGPPLLAPKPLISQVESGDGSRFHVKKRIIVGNVSKYIPPENREDSDPSTHKWMVYVRGPPEEPRIDHFVKRIWFFLHPSYRPNDLVEVKEPPFHLTRRGWGEFPIRIQLHFLDPRNKKVDIIHPLKLDRTYTGLQTLGAETIVDVELDRYLFDDHGQPLSRPMTPTITKVNYQEGIKPGSPGTSWDEARWRSASPRIKESGGRMPTIDIHPEEPGMGPVPAIKRSESVEASPSRVAVLKDDSSQKAEMQMDQVSSEARLAAEQGQSFSGIIGPSGIQPSSQAPPVGTASAGQIAMQQRQGGQFVRVMPPLGPITKSAVIVPSSLAGLSQQVPGPSSSPTKVITPTEDRSGSIVGSTSPSQASSANVSPTQPSVINVADAAFTGKGSLDIRIQEGKVVQEVTSPTQDIAQSKSEAKSNTAVMAQTVLPLVQQAPIKGTTILPTTAPSRIQSVQGVLVTAALQKPSQEVDGSVIVAGSQTGGIAVQPTSSQLNKPVMSASLSTTGTGIPAVKRIPSSGSITVVSTKSPAESPKHSPPATASGIPTSPPGTQYYITAKSTDPNLQGKVILIPQQVFQQASSQQAMGGGKLGVGKVSSPPGKAGPSKVATASSKSPFLSPSNVLILPAGSIVPPLPPGSIVQIQQVPSPVRATTASSQPKSQTTSAVTRAVTAPGKGTGPKISGLPSGGVIQIQRTTGTTVAKVSGIQGPSQTTGISILPEQKGQLAKTPSGGVVFVQRSPSGGKIGSGQTLTRLPLVQGSLALQQKITLAAQLPPGTVPIQQQGPLSLKPGSSVNIIQNPVPKSLQQGQTLVLHAQPSVQKVAGKSLQTVTAIRQPVVPGGQASKFIFQGQGSKVVTQGQLQVRLSGPATSVVPSRLTAATSTSATGGEPKAIVAGQVSDAAGLAVHGSASMTSEAGKQETEGPEAIPSSGGDRGNVSSSSSEEHVKNPTPSSETSSQKAEIIKDQMKEAASTTKTEITLEPTTGASASATAAETLLVHSTPQAKVVATQPVLGQPPSRIIIKQEPVANPQDYSLSTTIQRPMNPASVTTMGDIPIKMEMEEKEESDVSVVMRELTLSCMEGPVSVYGLRTMKELITAVVKKTPLINKDRVQSEHPYAATSLQHYHSWCGPKRRAAEWHRAVSVRRIATEAQVKSEKLRFERMWSTKEVMVWCRQWGYTPPEPGASKAEESWCNVCGDLSKKGRRVQPTAAGHDCSKHWLSSAGLLKTFTYTTPEEMTSDMQTQQAVIDQSSLDSDTEIDIIGVWNPVNRTRIKRELLEAQEGIRCYLPYSSGAKVVQEVAQEIGVCFKPTQLAPDTFAPVAEEVLFSAVSQFLNTLLRESLAKAYNKRTDNSLPKEILPVHVLRAIESTESCDFLSNKHLGILAMPTEENEETSA